MTRNIGCDGVLAEARCQAVSVQYELLRHDQWELAALESVDLLLSAGDVDGARRVNAELRHRDLRENRLHREITEAFEPQSRGRAG